MWYVRRPGVDLSHRVEGRGAPRRGDAGGVPGSRAQGGGGGGGVGAGPGAPGAKVQSPRAAAELASVRAEAEARQHSVALLEGQDSCMLCGERFEVFFDERDEEWMCRGAVYLNPSVAPGGAPGVPGQIQAQGELFIAHAKCRTDCRKLLKDMVCLLDSALIHAPQGHGMPLASAVFLLLDLLDSALITLLKDMVCPWHLSCSFFSTYPLMCSPLSLLAGSLQNILPPLQTSFARPLRFRSSHVASSSGCD